MSRPSLHRPPVWTLVVITAVIAIAAAAVILEVNDGICMSARISTAGVVPLSRSLDTVGPLARSVHDVAAVLGAIDDRQSLIGAQKHGMSARRKFGWQLAIATVAAVILYLPDPWGLGLHHVYIPFVGRYSIGLLYVPIAILTIVGMSNGVNLSDGLDSLAGGLTAIAFVAIGVIAYQQGQLGVVTLSFTMVGALLGFLWFNAHPAQVFMGDTGALALGATMAVAAFMTGQWLLLPIVGFVFVAETFSVILQVLYARRTGGKRIFRMAPLHHHFELQEGWSETQVTIRFWIFGMMAGLVGTALALL